MSIKNDPIYRGMRQRLNAMETPEEQMAFLTDVLRVATGLWGYFAKGQTQDNARKVMHALGAVLHAALMDNMTRAGLEDNIKVRLNYEGGHCHARVFINGALSGKLVVRIEEADTLGRVLLGAHIEEVANDGGPTGDIRP